MRPVASLVLFALTCTVLPAADGLDLSDLEQAAQGNAADADRWAQRRQRMRADFDKIRQLAERLTAEQRTQAWQRFLAAYAEKDPFDNADEDMRTQARSEIGAPAAPRQPEGSGDSPADPQRLAIAQAAYLEAKRSDLRPGPVEDKRRAWQDFLAQHGAEISGTTVDDEFRRWARIRLDALAQSPPAVLPAPLRVYPDIELDAEGTRVIAAKDDGLGYRLGVRAGDLIIAAGQPPHDLVGDPAALYAYVAGLRRDADLRLVVIRGDRVVAMPTSPAQPAARAPAPARPAQLGLRCLETQSELIVGAVDPGLIGACAGLDAGDRILALGDAAVATVAALEQAYAALPADAPLRLDIIRAGVHHRLSIPANGGETTWSVVDASAGWSAAPPPYRAPEMVAPPAVGPSPAPEAIVAAAATAPVPAPAAPEPAATPAKPPQQIPLGLHFEARDDGMVRIIGVDAAGVASTLGVRRGDMLVGIGDPPRAVRSWGLPAALAACTDAEPVRLVVVRHAPSTGKAVHRITVMPLPPPPEARAMRSPAPALRQPLGLWSYDNVPTVAALDPHGFAEAIGMMPGDRIISIDGRITATQDDIDRILRLANADPVALLRIRTWDGSEWQVTLPRAGGDAAWQRLPPATAR